MPTIRAVLELRNFFYLKDTKKHIRFGILMSKKLCEVLEDFVKLTDVQQT